MSPSEFLTVLFAGRDGKGAVNVWTPQTKRSTWLTHDLTLRLDPAYDWYFGPGIAAAPGDNRERIKADDVAGIPALWADIDYAHPAHKKDGLPPQDAALALCDALEPASIIVHTGHGYQAYWLFDSFWWLHQQASERLRAALLMQRWQAGLAEKAREMGGWALDATHDLSRVLRLPGTVNHKGEPVAVEVVRA